MQDLFEAYIYNDYNEPEDELSEAETVIQENLFISINSVKTTNK